MQFSPSPPRPPILHSHTHTTDKADSTLRSSQAVPHPSTNRALCRLTSEVRRDPVHSTWYGRRQDRWSGTHILLMQLGPGIVLSAVHNKDAESHDGHQHLLVMLRMLMMSLVMTSLMMMMGLMMMMVMMMTMIVNQPYCSCPGRSPCPRPSFPTQVAALRYQAKTIITSLAHCRQHGKRLPMLCLFRPSTQFL